MRFVLYILLVGALSIGSAFAEEKTKTEENGALIVGTDNRACSEALEGHLRWNAEKKIHEFCDGKDWRPL